MNFTEAQLRSELDRNLKNGEELEACKCANRLGNLLIEYGRYNEAEELFLLDYKITKKQKDKKELLTTVHSLGAVYFQLKAYTSAEGFMLEHLRLSEELYDDRERQRACTQLARLYAELYTNTAEMDSLEKAKRFTQLSLSLAEKLCARGNYFVELADALCNSGLLMLDTDDYQMAKKFLLQGLDVCNANELSGGVKSRIHFNLCVMYQGLYEEEDALEHNRQDIQICREHDLVLDLAKAYLQLGNIFLYSLKDDKADDFVSAEKAYKKALRIAESLEDEEELQASCSTNLEALEDARKMWSEFEEKLKEQKSYKRRWEVAARERDEEERRSMLKKYAKVLHQRAELAFLMRAWHKMAEMSKLLMEAAMEMNDCSLRDWACLNVAQAHLERKELNLARKYFSRGFEQCTVTNDTEGRSVAKAGLGSVEDHLGNYMQALHLFEEALQIAKEEGEERHCQQQLQAAENIHYIFLVRLSDKDKLRLAEQQVVEITRKLQAERALRSQEEERGSPPLNDDESAGEQPWRQRGQMEQESVLYELLETTDVFSVREIGLSRGRELVQRGQLSKLGAGASTSPQVNDPAMDQDESDTPSNPAGCQLAPAVAGMGSEDDEDPVAIPVSQKRKSVGKSRVIESDDEETQEEPLSPPAMADSEEEMPGGPSDASKRPKVAGKAGTEPHLETGTRQSPIAPSGTPNRAEDECGGQERRSESAMAPSAVFNGVTGVQTSASKGSELQNRNSTPRKSLFEKAGDVLVQIGERTLRLELEVDQLANQTVEWLADHLGLLYFMQNPLGNGRPGLLLSANGIALNPQQALRECLGSIPEDEWKLRGDIMGWIPPGDVPVAELYAVSCHAANQKVNRLVMDSLKGQGVETLRAANFGLADKDAKAIIWAKGRSGITPTEVDLSHNQIETPSVQTLVTVLASLGQEYLSLSLDLHSNRLGLTSVSLMSGSTVVTSRLEELNLSHNRLGDEGSRVIQHLLQRASNLRSLSMEDCGLQDKTVTGIASCLLRDCPSLSTLRLGCNPGVSPHTWESLIGHIHTSKRISVLDLKRSGLSNTAVEGALQLITASPGLTSLNISGNSIHSPLPLGLPSQGCHVQLAHLDVSGCNLPGHQLSQLMGLPSLMHADISNNTMSQDSLMVLASNLAKNLNPLRVLNMRNCGIGWQGIVTVLEALKENSTIETVDLSENIVEVEGSKAELEEIAEDSDTEDQEEPTAASRKLPRTVERGFPRQAAKCNPMETRLIEEASAHPEDNGAPERCLICARLQDRGLQDLILVRTGRELMRDGGVWCSRAIPEDVWEKLKDAMVALAGRLTCLNLSGNGVNLSEKQILTDLWKG